MTKIQINVADCTGCPFHKITTKFTAESWERIDDWFCIQSGTDKKIADQVEWADDIDVPDWCPIMVRDLVGEKDKPFYEVGNPYDEGE